MSSSKTMLELSATNLNIEGLNPFVTWHQEIKILMYVSYVKQ
jgi:hypothetical protein